MSARAPFRRLAVVIGAAALLVAGCSDDPAKPGGFAPPAGTPTLELKPTETKAERKEAAGFDECSLLTPEQAAEAVGVDAMYVTGRGAFSFEDGRHSVGCTYFPENVPGMRGMILSTLTETDEERFFAPMEDNFKNVEEIPNLGDRTSAVAYSADGTKNHYVEVRTLVGDQGLYLYYAYQEDGGVMPKADGAAAAKILALAMEKLPEKATIPNGTPEGPCADIDLDLAAEAIGADMEMARTVLTDEDALNCYFSGGAGSVDASLITDPTRVERSAPAPDAITHADIGDGAKLLITEANSLIALVITGDNLVAINVSFGNTKVTALRDVDVELVRTIVDAVA